MVLQIPLAIYERMMSYIRIATPNEITGLGIIDKIESTSGTDFIVKEIFLPEQIASPIHCELKAEAMINIMNDLLEREDDINANAHLCFHWHSHGESATFWSQIDEDDIRRWKGHYLVSLVTNTQGDLLARLDILNPDIGIYNIPMRCVILMPINSDIPEIYTNEVAEKVQFTEAWKTKEGRNFDKLL